MLYQYFCFGGSKGGNHKGFPLEFSPFWNPLSLTPFASRTLMTKSWYCQELYKRSFLMQTVNQMSGGKSSEFHNHTDPPRVGQKAEIR